MDGKQHADGLVASHLNEPILSPAPLEGEPTAEEKATIALLKAFDSTMAGFEEIQRTLRQTLGYGLVDSPAGQATWIYEKVADWTDSNRNPEAVLTRDAMLDNIMLYWLTATAASSARVHWESASHHLGRQVVDIPVGVRKFARDLYVPPRIWGERTHSKLFYWNRVPKEATSGRSSSPRCSPRNCRRVSPVSGPSNTARA